MPADVPDVEGITGALARITELQGKLSTLRPPARGGPVRRAAPRPAGAAARPAGAAPAAAARAPPGVARSGPPRCKQATPAGGGAGLTWPNGEIPASELTSIGGRERLTSRAADGFLQMRAAAARDGVELPVNDSYRSLAEQEDMAERKGLYSEGGLAAKPGTSTHGLGVSVDLQLDDRALTWMRANGERYGFAEDVPREPWHWTYTPGKA